MAVLFTVNGVDELVDCFGLVQSVYPQEVKKFMRSEGSKLRTRTVKVAKSSVNKITGNYLKGIKRGKYYKYAPTGADAIRVYAGKPAYHAHLLEYGHVKVLWGRRTNGRVQAFNIFQTAGNAFESVYDSDCEAFADKIADMLN